jgi:hypothetical protein
MFKSMPKRPVVVVGAAGALAYVGAFTLNCWASEPPETHPAPVGAVYGPSMASTALTSGEAQVKVRGNTMGDETIVQVWGSGRKAEQGTAGPPLLNSIILP